MILYNITINIENDVREEWLKWMKDEHIPEVMETGHFIENKIFKVLVEEDQGTTYSVQYTCDNMKKLEEYHRFDAPRLQKKHTEKFANNFVAFSTLLERVE